MDNCDDAPECEGEYMNYCADETTLMVCHTFPDEWDNYYEAVDCYDPETCDCGSGCADAEDTFSCWCCETDGGTGDPDAGVDAGE
jgi:hypothetical protein